MAQWRDWLAARKLTLHIGKRCDRALAVTAGEGYQVRENFRMLRAINHSAGSNRMVRNELFEQTAIDGAGKSCLR